MGRAFSTPVPARDMDEADLPAMPPAPFLRQIDVGWGDCDPAQIAYTGAIPNFSLRVLEQWWMALTGRNWFRLNMEYGLDTPFARLAVDFRAPVTPLAPLDCRVIVEKLGTTSLVKRVEGRQDGALCFECRTVNVFVDRANFEKMPIPPVIRARIAAWAASDA